MQEWVGGCLPLTFSILWFSLLGSYMVGSCPSSRKLFLCVIRWTYSHLLCALCVYLVYGILLIAFVSWSKISNCNLDNKETWWKQINVYVVWMRWSEIVIVRGFRSVFNEIDNSWYRMSETEAPFRPREKLFEKQKYFQNIHKHTYLKGPMDKITSVAIPLALAGTSLFLIVSVFLSLHKPYFSIYNLCRNRK